MAQLELATVKLAVKKNMMWPRAEHAKNFQPVCRKWRLSTETTARAESRFAAKAIPRTHIFVT
jgi:hypothetical protein